MKRRAEEEDRASKSCKKEGMLKRKKSAKKLKRYSTGSMNTASSTSSLAPSLSSCADSIVFADEHRPEAMLDLTVRHTDPVSKPPLTPRTSSVSRSTVFFGKKSKLNDMMTEGRIQGEPATNSPLLPTPPRHRTLDATIADLPLPPPIAGRDYTVSVALPGSICDNAQSPELRTYLAGQVARALSIFNVDEVVIFNDNPGVKIKTSAFDGVTKKTNANIVLARILQYLETPQYLRKALFPFHQDLKYAGLLNPLDCPHHMRASEETPFREGVVIKRPVKKNNGSFVDCGIDRNVQIDKLLNPGTRLTVRMESYNTEAKCYRGTAVSPDCPRQELGTYWGYRVRLADSFHAALTESIYKEGYDLTIGTSDTGVNVDKVKIRHFRHVIIFLGGLQGLEPVIESDEALKQTDPRDLFDYYVNVCPNQGSRTIRTEEALIITLSSLRNQITENGMNG